MVNGFTSLRGAVFLSLALQAFCLLSRPGLAAERPRPAVTTGPAATLRDAYELSKTADSAEQFTRIIDLCQKGLDAGANEAETSYGQQLMSWAFNKRGEARAAAGQEKQALEDFENAVRLDSRAWRAMHNRGVSRAILGKKIEAKADFDRVVELNPKFATAWFNLGEWFYDRGDFREAIANYDKALALQPEDVSALLSRGHAHYKLDEHTAAMSDYNRALQISPESASAHVYRAAVLADIGQYAQATDDYRAAIRLEPDRGQTFQASAWLLATCPDEKFRNPQLAVQAAQRAIELDGDHDFHYLETLAAAQAAAGRFDAAKATQQKAIAAAGSDNPEAMGVLKSRLALYSAGRPYREPSRQPAATPVPQHRLGRRR